jgi:hypothetical protein
MGALLRFAFVRKHPTKNKGDPGASCAQVDLAEKGMA